jgi:hypothetical protein
MMTNVLVVMITLITMLVNVQVPVQINIGQMMIQTLVNLVMPLAKLVSEESIIIVIHAQKEPISMNMNVKSHVPMELMKKKHQSKHARIVTKDVPFVKTKHTSNVEFVTQDTTYMKPLV